MFALAALLCLAALLALIGFWPGSKAGSFEMAAATPAKSAKPLMSGSAPPSGLGVLGATGSREGPFSVFSSPQRRPSVRIVNHGDIPIHFVLRDRDGRQLSMEVAPNSDNVLQADVTHYEAEAFDPSGVVQSAAGDATFREFHEYRAEFWIGHSADDNSFHIGD